MKYLQSLSEQDQAAWATAFFGNDETGQYVEVDGFTVGLNTDGCVATARRQLYGDQLEWLRLTTAAVHTQIDPN